MEKNNIMGISASQWIPIYQKIRNQNTYKFMYSDIDNYVAKIENMFTQNFKFQGNVIKKAEHSKLIFDLKANFMRVVGDLQMIDLPNLAMCVEYVIEKLIDLVRDLFINYTSSNNIIRELQSANSVKKLATDMCLDCQTNMYRKNIDNMMTKMTIGDCMQTNRQVKAVKSQLQQFASDYEDVQLSILIDEMLQHKDAIFNVKKNPTNTLYDEIAQYLESIPQSVIQLSRENREIDRMELMQIANVSNELQSVLNQVIQKPLKKLIKRVLEYSKQLYSPGQKTSNATQTPFSQDAERIKSLEKDKMILKHDIQKIRELKRQSQKQMISMIDQQKIIEIKYSELYSKHTLLCSDHEKMKKQFESTKQKLRECQFSKKQMGNRLIGDYSTQKSVFLKTIKNMKQEMDAVTFQNKRLKKQTQNLMVSVQTQIFYQDFNQEVQIQTQLNFAEEFVQLSKSKKNSMIRFVSMYKGDSTKDKFLEEDFIVEPKTKVDLCEQNSNQKGPQPQHSQIIENQREQVPSNEKKKKKFIDKGQNKMSQISNMQLEEKDIIEMRQKKESIIPKRKESIFLKIKQQKSLPKREKILSRIGIDDNFFNEEDKSAIQQYNGISIMGYSRNPAVQLSYRSRQSIQRFSSSIDLSREPEAPVAQPSMMFLSHRHNKKLLQNAKNAENNKTGNRSSNYGNFHEWLQLSNEKTKLDPEKKKMMQSIWKHYQILGKKGIFDKILQIISDSQKKYDYKALSKNWEKQNKKNVLAHKQIKSCLEQPKLFICKSNTIGQQFFSPKIQKTSKKIQIHQPIFNIKKKQGKYSSLSHSHFTRNQVISLFISYKYIKKYEKSEDIWGILNGVIAIDCNNHIRGKKIELFLKELQNYNIELYNQCWKLLNFPLNYIDFLLQQNANSMSKSKSNFSGMKAINKKNKDTGEKKQENKEQIALISKEPEQLKQIILKLFKFHKLIHQKCSHVDQFLGKLGYSQAFMC